MSFDVAKWNKKRYLAEAGILQEDEMDTLHDLIYNANPSYPNLAKALAKFLKGTEEDLNSGFSKDQIKDFMKILHTELGMNETLNEAEYTWKNDRELSNQEGRAIGELSDLIYDLEEYISPNIRGLAKTATLKGLATGLAADEIRGFVSVYKDDLAGIRVFKKGNSATWEPIWKDKEPKSMTGPDPRVAGSLD